MFDQAENLRELMRTIKNEEKRDNFITLQQKLPRVIAVSGGKGGVGKTLTTANLGLCFVRMGMRTLLIDGDFGLANLDVMMNLRPQFTLDDVFAGEITLKDIVLTGPEGIKIVPSSSGILKVAELNRMQKLTLLDQIESLDEEFDIVIVDTPAGVSQNVQYWTSSSSEVVMVVTPEPTSMADCYATMKILSQTTKETSFKVIVNMVQNEQEGLRIFERLSSIAEEYLGVRVGFLGSIPFDEQLRYSVRERVPCVQRYPFSKASHQFREIARSVIASPQEQASKGTMQFFWKKMISNAAFY